MTTNPVCIRLEPDGLSQVLQTEAMAAVQASEGALDLDLSAIFRIDTGASRALEELAGAAGQRGTRIRLHKVNVNVYKTLMLLNLVRRFTFSD